MKIKSISIGRKTYKYGTVLAMIISFTVNKSVLWAIFHGIFSWFYVIYYCIKY
jgi:hypothetical protein